MNEEIGRSKKAAASDMTLAATCWAASIWIFPFRLRSKTDRESSGANRGRKGGARERADDILFYRATPHKCNDTHCRIAILWKAIGLPRTFARKSALTQAARQGLSARIRFANANMMLNLAPCFSSPRYRVFRKRSCFLTTPNTCSTFARTEDFACSAFFAAY